ncbi:MAG: hypothetical protein Q8M31_22860 [Beijerinckiaceae bacterium]|nr:hypothetical protein [Beijerinckiaceae bacterium]
MIVEAAALAISLGASGIYADAVYRPAQRAVSNWRVQAALNIDAPAQTILRFVSFNEPANLPRCVRLNNYWCVKSARWNGEIASDTEGHVAFSSAHEGALVAAQLLRRYYVDYGRKSAMAIVSRWAPAECVAAPSATGRTRATGVRQKSRSASRANGLATRGIQNTARARWLAANRGRVAGGRATARKPALRASRVALPAIPMMRAPEIAVGMGERGPQPATMRIAPVRLASLGVPDAPRMAEPSLPHMACASDGVRIRNYAAALAKGVSGGALDDLKLFDDKGLPTPALARAMSNMAAVEIGPMKAADDMIARAVDAQTALLRERLEQAPPVELPPAPPPSGVPADPPPPAP